MVNVAVRPLQQTPRLSWLFLLASAACGRFGFDVHAIDDGAVVSPSDGGSDGMSTGGSSGGNTGGSSTGDGDAADADGGPADACATVSGAVVCESFEDDDLGNNVERKISDGKLRIEGGSLLASIERGGGKAALRWNFDKQKEGSLYLRVALTVPKGVGIESLSVSTLASAEKHTDIAFNLLSGERLQVSIQEDSRALAGAYDGTRGTPMCLKARIDIDESAGDVKVGIDAAADVSADNVDTLPGRGISELKVGIGASASDQAPITVRIHEVVLSANDPGPCQ